MGFKIVSNGQKTYFDRLIASKYIKPRVGRFYETVGYSGLVFCFPIRFMRFYAEIYILDIFKHFSVLKLVSSDCRVLNALNWI